MGLTPHYPYHDNETDVNGCGKEEVEGKMNGHGDKANGGDDEDKAGGESVIVGTCC